MTKSDSVRNQRNGFGYGDRCSRRCYDHQIAARASYDALAGKMELVDARQAIATEAGRNGLNVNLEAGT